MTTLGIEPCERTDLREQARHRQTAPKHAKAWRRVPARSHRQVAAVIAVTLAAALAGCTSSQPKVTWHEPGELEDPAKIAIDFPKPAQKRVATSAEVGLHVQGADEVDVTLTAKNGSTVEGAMREDGSTWVPSKQLAYDTTYDVKAVAVNASGKKTVETSKFTTMSKPSQLVGAGLYLFDGQEVGIGMPVVVEFTNAVKDRAAVEKRLFVHSEPKVEGSWHWFSNTQVHFRPKEHWKPGTKLSVRIGIGGVPFGGGRYGMRDRVARDVTVGPDVRLEVDNKTKKLTYIKNGKALRSMPVSLGKSSTPSSSGKMVIMDKRSSMVFDSSTYGVPASSAGGYRTTVQYAMRLTWGGEFIHAAPWSVADQGHRNVSHGCVNLSTANAQYIFNNVRIGDPVTVKNTETHVGKGDGWTGWDLSWEDYRAGSALT